MNTHTADTSRAVQSDNYKRMTAAKLSRGQQLVMNAVLLAHARRQRDLSTTEICLVMEEQLGRRVASNDISGRITELPLLVKLVRHRRRGVVDRGGLDRRHVRCLLNRPPLGR